MLSLKIGTVHDVDLVEVSVTAVLLDAMTLFLDNTMSMTTIRPRCQEQVHHAKHSTP